MVSILFDHGLGDGLRAKMKLPRYGNIYMLVRAHWR